MAAPRRRRPDTGRDPSPRELAEVRRLERFPDEVLRDHPRARQADPAKLAHIHTYGARPDYYIDRAFQCRDCGKWEIWRADDQKWYLEEAKGHMDARAVRCHACRVGRRG